MIREFFDPGIGDELKTWHTVESEHHRPDRLDIGFSAHQKNGAWRVLHGFTALLLMPDCKAVVHTKEFDDFGTRHTSDYPQW
jgi:hypothetical protein